MNELDLVSILLYIIISIWRCIDPIISRIILLIWFIIIACLKQIRNRLHLTKVYFFIVTDVGIAIYEYIYQNNINYYPCVKDEYNYSLYDVIYFYLIFTVIIFNKYMEQIKNLENLKLSHSLNSYLLNKEYELKSFNLTLHSLEHIYFLSIIYFMILKSFDIISLHYFQQTIMFGACCSFILRSIFY